MNAAPPPAIAAPPRLATLPFWLTVVGPALFVLASNLLISTLHTQPADFTQTLGLAFIVGFCAWLSFANLIAARYRGPSRLILVIAYPFIQAPVALVLWAVSAGLMGYSSYLT